MDLLDRWPEMAHRWADAVEELSAELEDDEGAFMGAVAESIRANADVAVEVTDRHRARLEVIDRGHQLSLVAAR